MKINTKSIKNKLTNIMRICEKQFYSIELQKTKNNVRGTWKVLNKILNKNKDNLKNSLKFIIDGKTVFNTPKEIVNGFNKYSTEVGQCLSSNISSGRGSTYDYLNRDCINSMYLKKFKKKKSIDTNGLSMNII